MFRFWGPILEARRLESSSGYSNTTPGVGPVRLRLDLLWSYERLSSLGSKSLVRANCKSPTDLRRNALLTLTFR